MPGPMVSLLEGEVNAAMKVLESALMADDPTAWVYEYTVDAVFDGGGADVVQGRAALLELAKAMVPMRDVSVRTLRVEGSGDYATVWFEASYTNGTGSGGSSVDVRGMLLWRREADGQWRVALEHL